MNASVIITVPKMKIVSITIVMIHVNLMNVERMLNVRSKIIKPHAPACQIIGVIHTTVARIMNAFQIWSVMQIWHVTMKSVSIHVKLPMLVARMLSAKHYRMLQHATAQKNGVEILTPNALNVGLVTSIF